MTHRILVTGGAGYIGSMLVPALLAQGHQVTVLDRFLFDDTSLLACCSNPGFAVVRGDCRDERTMASLVPQHDVIIPLAALVGAPLCDADRVGAISTNLDAIRLLCRITSPSQRILFPTTNSGYGVGRPGEPCTETSPLAPVSLYGETKVEAERVVLDRGSAITFRLATVFGAAPRMRLDLLVNNFVYRAVTEASIVLFESHFTRNFIHVRDVARVFLHGLDQFDQMQGRAFNVGLDDANLTKRELCERIAAHVPGFTIIDAPIGRDPDQRNYLVSNARLAATGFVPSWTIDDGIRELVVACRMVRRHGHASSVS
ncbi:MAG: NAD(P)-dependent oxidoreductase [Acidobacteria bacterium]|nr:NAD(P)-dependent oxidoreductase [Acidobacteriota bacterium]